MKLLSLNTWAGKEFGALIEYISKRSIEIDIFCFQEVFNTPTEEKVANKVYRANLFSELEKVLPDHKGYFAPAQDYQGTRGINFQLSFGIAMFVRKSLKVKKIGNFFIRGSRNSRTADYKNTLPYNLQYAVIGTKEKDYNITHFHGLWNGKGKDDTEERIEQSKKIKNYIDQNNKRLVLCGDFNLLPTTKSLEILEENLINLIKINKIKSTRSSLYTKPVKFADYTLISKDITVKNFEVPKVDVSDHLPMILEFS